jgi:hypothetical protein
MNDPTSLGADNAEKLRKRRENRVDHVHDIPFNERTTVECPDCDETTATLILGGEIRSYGPCWNWDCDSFHKFRRDRSAETDDDQDDDQDVDAESSDTQKTLVAFGGSE